MSKIDLETPPALSNWHDPDYAQKLLARKKAVAEEAKKRPGFSGSPAYNVAGEAAHRTVAELKL